MNQIWKYELKITDYQEVEMPISSRILHVGEQEGRLCLWAIVGIEEDAPSSLVPFLVCGTGNPLPEEIGLDYFGAKHIGTAVMSNGFVWHVFKPHLRRMGY